MSLLDQKYPWSKWRKHVALLKEAELKEYLPDTALLNSKSLERFLFNYPVVFAKPCLGGGGRGVLKITVFEEKVEIATTANRFQVSHDDVYAKIQKLTGDVKYVVQQGIDLLTIDSRPIDFRTLLIKHRMDWKYMGVMGKLAVKEQIVTNHCRGGDSIVFKHAMEQSADMSEEEADLLEEKLKSLSLAIAEALQRRFPRIAELGLDIGIDKELRLWLIEANTRPQYKLFKDHGDRTLYKRINTMIHTVRLPLKPPAKRQSG